MKDKVTFTMKPDEITPAEFLDRDLSVTVNLRELAQNMQTVLNCLTGGIPRLNKDCGECDLFDNCTIIIASIPIMLGVNSFMEKLSDEGKVTQ